MNTQPAFYSINRTAVTPMQNFDESQALDGLRNLDSQAIGAVYDQYFPAVYRYVRYRLNDEQLAEDIASDVFMRLLEALQSMRGPQTNLKAWLLSTASHIVADHLRRAYRRPTEALSENQLDSAPAPHDEFDRREQARNFRQAYTQLTPEQQHVLALRFGQGFSLEETSSVLKKNVNAVKALQFRALAALQRSIGEVDHE
ncbi:MAG: sigma-70 family RNA polymerase sigma factor [Chloroflexi bacterium]|nr:sigma-70 family RNA polymerase sigma factor [Chloroflexota bacterium]MBI3340472.1 sigma-70 family RNA polymerase sigma factor [Chloroflexota bacterium]